MIADSQRGTFLRLLEVYEPALRRLAQAYVRHPSDAQDLFQEIALAVWQALPRFRAEASERTWLYRIAHNVAITTAGKRRRREQQESPEVPVEGAASRTVVEELLDRERRGALLEAIRQLPIPDRQVVLLHLEGLSAGEIEDVTGSSSGAIATRLTRIRARLTELVQRKGAVR